MIYFRVILFVLLGLHVSPTSASESETIWNPIPEHDWQIPDDALHEYGAILLSEKIIADDRRMDENRCYFTLYRKIKINNKEARKWANVKAPIIHEQQKIKGIKGRTTLESGEHFFLSQSQILEKNIYKTSQVEIDQLSFAMPGVSDNSIIEYTIKYEIPEPNHKWLFQKELPLVAGDYRWLTYQFQPKDYFDFKNYFNHFSSDNGRRVTNPDDRSPNRNIFTVANRLIPDFVWLQNDQEIKTEFLPSEKEPKQIIFSVKNVPAFEEEPLSLPENSLKHQLRCYYLDGDPKTYWKSVAKNTVEVIESYSRLDQKMNEITKQFKQLATEPERISACYDWLQANIQTITFNSYKRNKVTELTVDEILERGYGTVTEINYLFYFMLKDMGIDAYMAYTSNRTQNIFYPEVRQLEFDVNLVAVPGWDIEYRFYSPGEIFLPETQIPWYVEGAMAFLVNEHSFGFHNISYSSPILNKTKRVTWLKVDEQFDCVGKIYQVYEGHEARKYQMLPENLAISYWEEFLLDEFKNTIPEFFPRATYSKQKYANRPNKSFYSKVKLSLLQNHITPRLFFRPADFMMKLENPFHRQTRTQPIVFDYAYELIDVVHIELPHLWQIEAKPEKFEFKNVVGLCEVDFFATGNLFSVQRKFRLNKPVWQADDYDEVCNLFKSQQMSTLLTAVIKVDESTTLSLAD